MSVTGAIGSFATGTYTLVRSSVGTYTRGRYGAGASVSSTITACVQPITGRDLQALPEGQRADETRVIYTTTELRTRHPSSDPDRVIIDSEAWEVFRVQRWEAFGTTHFRAFASRLTPNTTAYGTAEVTASDTVTSAGTVT